jgi:hypothetical protein
LLDAIFKNSEIFLLKTRNDPIHGIGNGHIYQRQVGFGLERFGF